MLQGLLFVKLYVTMLSIGQIMLYNNFYLLDYMLQGFKLARLYFTRDYREIKYYTGLCQLDLALLKGLIKCYTASYWIY